jgi:hypothetical protein
MEAVWASEKLVNLFQSTLCYNPEDNHLHNYCSENPKLYSESDSPHKEKPKSQGVWGLSVPAMGRLTVDYLIVLLCSGIWSAIEP